EKDPVTEKPLSPAVPAVLGTGEIAITPIPLPLGAYYPELRPEFREELIAGCRRRVVAAQEEIRRVADGVVSLEKKLAQLADGAVLPVVASAGDPFLVETFEKPRPDLWQVLSGQWENENGHLVGKQIGSFLTMVTRANHPADFQARVRYKTLEPGSVHSVGVSFDVTENARDWQAVYTATNNTTSTVQAFHRVAGVEAYPQAGIVPFPFKLNDLLTVDLAVRGSLLNVWVNGELKIAYKLPTPRQAGRFALWLHSATAEFHELRIEPISAELRLAESTATPTLSPFGMQTRADLEVQIAQARGREPALQGALTLARAEAAAIEARVAAEIAKHTEPAPTNRTELAMAAGKAERQVAVLIAESAVSVAELASNTARNAVQPGNEASMKAAADAEAKLAVARKALDDARAALAKEDPSYTPLGTAYANSTTGRRLALARWITSRANPLTARVAVNHMWLRHFGTALVPSVFNFGLNGKRPSHPELLDWLALEFMERGWSTRAIHRLMVTSNTYRMQSQESGVDDPNLTSDRENRWYWRANSKRLEAEVVRDGLLHLAGVLDPTRGGVDLEPNQADSVLRRSLYFRHTPDDRALMLELFDAANASECYQRDESIVPQQALALVNGVFAYDQSRRIARKLATGDATGAGSVPVDDPEFVTRVFEQVLARTPREDERRLCEKYLVEQTARYVGGTGLTPVPTGPAATIKPAKDPHDRARESLVHVLVNYNEFLVVR
ncbi:MAG: DUF1553 domain-containing protein, partial [Planctomycetota bacterium]|nr:DUF1553 domain-containing protein [Planctomycetota bacterium]